MSSTDDNLMSPQDSTAVVLPNRLGIHALVWVGGWSREECVRAVSSAAEAGYQVIEIPALDPGAIDVEHTREILRQYGVEATVSLGLSKDVADINDEDPDVVRAGLDLLRSALRVVHELGGTYLGGVLYGALAKYERVATPAARRNAVHSLRTLAQEAVEWGITLGLEPVNRYESNLINTVAQCLELIADIGADNVVVHLDIYHMNIEETDLVSPVSACAKENKLGYVHIGANHRGSLTTSGNIDFDAFFGALAAVGYTGIITFESFSSAVVDENLTNALAIWRNTWTDNKQLAVEARQFIQTKIAKVHDSTA